MTRTGAAAGPRIPNGRPAIPACMSRIRLPVAPSASAPSSPTARTSVRRMSRTLHVLHREGVLSDLQELGVGVHDRVGLVPHAQLALVHPDRGVAQLLDRAE